MSFGDDVHDVEPLPLPLPTPINARRAPELREAARAAFAVVFDATVLDEDRVDDALDALERWRSAAVDGE